MALMAFFTVVGMLTTAVVGLAAAYYVVTRRPTPNATVREALTSIRWSYAAAFFILPGVVVGYQEGIPVLGVAVGGGFVLFILVLQWWFGPL